MDLMLLKISFVMHIVSVIWLLNALLLVLIILIQKGKGGGLSGVLGGGGAGGLLGSKTGDFLTWVTVGLCCSFILMTIIMAKGYKPQKVGIIDEPAPVTQSATTENAPAINVEETAEEVIGEINVVGEEQK